ncbi:MAG: 16S rRNA (cytosine(967)-C(5))-methyltransferase RsmB [Deltaproteobacteria bacterium]|nr:16S rRNA (cytosine(967)-C(5))-methyltransferase RsmB [Deltaproteobacteria bacterium]
MRRKSPRAICLQILNQLEKAGGHTDRLLSDSFKRYRHLTPLDRAFLTELTYGVLRWREKLDWSIRHLLNIPFEKIEMETLNILRLGLYQIEFLTRTPASAAVNESVELAKRHRGSGGGGFVNAILRSFLRKKEEIPYPEIDQDPALHLSVIHSHPLWLVQRWIKEMGIEETLDACVFNNRISPLTLRTNTLKMGREELIEKLGKKGLKGIPASFSSEGIRLEDPPPTSELPFLNDGFFIIQDEASQLVTSVLDPKAGEKILDGCASPGGKTTHMAQKMENKGEIYALDLTRDKLVFIEEMCRRLGIEIVKTWKGDATQFLPGLEGITFDRVLADVPCSGFGTLRKNPDLKWRKGEGDIKRLSDLQLEILTHLSGHVKKGGVLVYSTCTVFREENEDVVEKFLEGHPEFQLDRMDHVASAFTADGKSEGIHSFIQSGYIKTFPPKDGMDGFFVARLIKKD